MSDDNIMLWDEVLAQANGCITGYDNLRVKYKTAFESYMSLVACRLDDLGYEPVRQGVNNGSEKLGQRSSLQTRSRQSGRPDRPGEDGAGQTRGGGDPDPEEGPAAGQPGEPTSERLRYYQAVGMALQEEVDGLRAYIDHMEAAAARWRSIAQRDICDI